MVESSSRANINFIKLTSTELSSKIALLVSNKERIIFWKISPRYFEGKAASFSVKGKTQLTISETNIHVKIQNENICLNFTLNEIDYFLRAKVIEQDAEKNSITIELEEFCFRVEKRAKERLITYPVYEVYAYLKYTKEFKPNVVSINKLEQKNKDFFNVIDNLQKNKIMSLAADLEIQDEEDLVGFRVEDLSSNGLSFFASQKEKDLILDSIEDGNFKLTLNFEMQVFNLEEASFVYKMNYINPQLSGIPMYKIGIQFKPSPSLKRKIEDISGIVVDLSNYQKEFEEFIKNE